MPDYLKPTDPGAFQDLPVKPRPSAGDAMFPRPVLCPRCLGHGGWNLVLNEYPNSAYPHFRCNCNACNGWGWLNEDQEPWDKWEERVRDTWRSRIVAAKTIYPALKGVIVTCKEMVFDPAHPGKDLTCALLHACDGWDIGNFGGQVYYQGELPEGYWYRVWVFTD